MSEPTVIQLGGGANPITVEVTGGTPAYELDSLQDVAGATQALAGQVLVKNTDGIWRPATLSGDGSGTTTLSYTHTQDSLSTVWLIEHGLAFTPAGVEVFDHLGDRHYPVLSYPETGLVRLDFLTPIRGTARLS